MNSTDTILPIVAPPIGIHLVVSTLGILGNIHIVASVKYKYVRTVCTSLISLIALDDIFHQASHYIAAYVLLSNQLFMKQSICFYYQLLPVFATCHSIPLCFFISFDRMLSCYISLKYGKVTAKNNFYIILLGVIPTLYALGIVIHVYMHIPPDATTMCFITGFFPLKSADLWAQTSLMCHGLTILAYGSIWIFMYRKKQIGMKVSMKPVTIMSLLVICGWILTMSLYNVEIIMGVSGNNLYGASMYNGIFVNLTMACNFIVYFKLSTDHRRAFKEMWNFKSTKVSPVSSVR